MEIMSVMDVVDSLVKSLDSKYASWDLYRTAMRQWCVKAGGESWVCDSLVECMIRAVEYVPLLKIPRRPMPVDDLVVFKCGSKWSVQTSRGHWVSGNISTKAKAVELVNVLTRKTQAAMDEWDLRFGPVVCFGVEGETFVYEV